MHDRPLLLLDVDDPFNPHRAIAPPPGYQRHDIRERDGGRIDDEVTDHDCLPVPQFPESVNTCCVRSMRDAG
jgi:hypothetical protein